MKRFLAVVGVAIVLLSATGCREASVSGFSGRWVEQGNTEAKHPRLLTIVAERDVFLVDESIYLAGEYKIQREVAKPVSDSLLSLKGGMRNIRYEEGAIYYRNLKFVKAI